MLRRSLETISSLQLLIIISLGIWFCLDQVNLLIGINVDSTSVVAQTLRPEMAAQQVYQRLNQLPLENQYLSRETGQIDPDNTLVNRLIRYHQYVKNRPLGYRIDWKLTLADYLGVNEPFQPSRYPGSKTLQKNPLERDRTIINDLTRQQRNELIETLVSIYNPQTPSSQPSNSSSPSPTNSTSQPRLPQPGDAELLLP